MGNNIVSWIMMGFWCILSVLLLIKLARYIFAPVKTARATVVDKSKTRLLSTKDPQRYRYTVVFSVEGKKRGFYISEFSYGGYRVGERGTLTYKGDRLIEFR